MRKNSRHSSGESGSSGDGLLFCDLTQSWSEQGGGVRTYLVNKRQHIIDQGRDRHLLIIPGAADEVTHDGRAPGMISKWRSRPGSMMCWRLLTR